ncbi:hypothetical protein [Aurantiacibacter odishensis]|uniref:hypothetical protein n=1 Tax=Aurantiacibacter odishensis TaxID=1155476 RepID=UPI000E747149|nr:hypothetical protein [Aurantiacibacter odishensis]
MVDAHSVISDIQRRYALDWESQAPTQEDIIAWSGRTGEKQSALYDLIGAHLALGYHEGRFSFAFCDEVVNVLYGVMIAQQTQKSPPPWPQLFFRVYEAFDAGEYANPSSPPHDPVKTHTDPEIAEIVHEL